MSSEITGKIGVVPLGRIDFEAIRFFKVKNMIDEFNWIGRENPNQALGFIPKWICYNEKTMGIAVRDDLTDLKHIWNLAEFIQEKHGFNIEYQISPAEEVVKAIEKHFPDKMPRTGINLF